MVLVVVALRRAGMLKKQGLGTIAWGGVQVQVNIVLPADPNFHPANHDDGRRLGRFRQTVAGEPVRHFHVSADVQHLHLGLPRINRPAHGDCLRPGGPLAKTPQRGGKITGEDRQARRPPFQIQSPKARDFVLVQVIDPRIAKICPMHDHRRRRIGVPAESKDRRFAGGLKMPVGRKVSVHHRERRFFRVLIQGTAHQQYQEGGTAAGPIFGEEIAELRRSQGAVEVQARVGRLRVVLR